MVKIFCKVIKLILMEILHAIWPFPKTSNFFRIVQGDKRKFADNLLPPEGYYLNNFWDILLFDAKFGRKTYRNYLIELLVTTI